MNFTYTSMAYMIVFLDWIVANLFWISIGLIILIFIAIFFIYACGGWN